MLAALLPPAAWAYEIPFKSNREMRSTDVATAWTAEQRRAIAAGEPILLVDFPRREAIPGQPLSLRLTIYTPTYMPRAPRWPDFESPDLRVRLPEGATRPESRRIAGSTWSGMTREYRISPMVPGRFMLPAAAIGVTWADPDSNQPRQLQLRTQALPLLGVLPAGTEDLEPFIAARSLTLHQQVSGDPGAMHPGDAVTRTLTARLEGLSPIFLPQLLPPTRIPGVAVYKDEALVREKPTGDAGERVERITLMAESGGSGTAPAVHLRWYNIDSGELETASAESIDVVVSGPPASGNAPHAKRRTAAWLAGLLLLLWPAWHAFSWLLRSLRRGVAAVWQRWKRSEHCAWRVLERSLVRRDRIALERALDDWSQHYPGAQLRQSPEVQRCLLALGHAAYSTSPGNTKAAWLSLRRTLTAVRKAHRSRRRHFAPLPPLNPWQLAADQPSADHLSAYSHRAGASR